MDNNIVPTFRQRLGLIWDVLRLEFMYWTTWRWAMPLGFLDDVRIGANAAWRKSIQRRGDDERRLTKSRRRWLGESLILGIHRQCDYLFPPRASEGNENHWIYKWRETPEGIVYLAIEAAWRECKRVELTSVIPFVKGSVGAAFVASLTDYVPRDADSIRILRTWAS